ncbi:site-specific integrase [uncultured Agrobacterium sp.]|uniref:tyrosine-type recombinase/integrase n=1 Tax=uncultured Agrobacterium sp. TaxID=157277 RepID=UPI0025F80FD7|nr:site-specific integrase [uncultured Agrobacterium sp.]
MSTKSENPYSIWWSKFANGERMPFLVPSATGVPLEAPTFWILADRRPLGLQPNTLTNELRSLSHLFLWGDARGIDVVKRVREGIFFSLLETLDIVNFCSRRVAEAIAELHERLPTVVKLQARRKRHVQIVGFGEKRHRLAAIKSFIVFTSAEILSNLARWPQRHQQYGAVRNEFLELIDGHISGLAKTGRNDLDLPEGLADAAVKRLREVIEPDHPENPFHPSGRFRNYLIVRLLLDLGIRRGELLGIKVADCQLGSKGMITIHRRPDDPADPRREKPATKTKARILALSPRLAEILYEYIVHHRARIPNARRHPFLVVSTDSGKPMSLSNVNKIMEALRDRVPGLPEKLGPHRLRHTWNDAFSEDMDEKKVSAEDEVKWRTRLQGWRSESSAQSYLRRAVRRRSNEALRQMQEKLDIAASRGNE